MVPQNGARLLLARDLAALLASPLPGISAPVVDDLLWSIRVVGSKGSLYEVMAFHAKDHRCSHNLHSAGCNAVCPS